MRYSELLLPFLELLFFALSEVLTTVELKHIKSRVRLQRVVVNVMLLLEDHLDRLSGILVKATIELWEPFQLGVESVELARSLRKLVGLLLILGVIVSNLGKLLLSLDFGALLPREVGDLLRVAFLGRSQLLKLHLSFSSINGVV